MVPAQHVWVFGGHCAPQSIGTPAALEKEVECMLVLGQWPDTSEEIWINQMKEIHSNIPAEFQDMTLAQASEQIVKLVRDHSVPSIFKQMRVSPTAVAVITERNAKRLPERRHFRMDHIPDMFMGAQVPWDPPNTPVLTTMEICHMIALGGIIQRQQLSFL
jgi:hypothetical protein